MSAHQFFVPASNRRSTSRCTVCSVMPTPSVTVAAWIVSARYTPAHTFLCMILC